jgi:hypothetical protein
MIGDMPLEENLRDRRPLSLDEWVLERYENCIRHAAMKTGTDQGGWLEDAGYFRAILMVLAPAPRSAEPVPAEGSEPHVGWIAGHCSDPLNCSVCKREGDKPLAAPSLDRNWTVESIALATNSLPEALREIEKAKE